MSVAAQPAPARPPLWRDVRVLRIALQGVFLLALAGVAIFVYDNLTTNFAERGIRTDFRYLRQQAGFAIPDADFVSHETMFAALVEGAKNTAKVAFIGIFFATVLGVVAGVARLSENWLVRRTAAVYVETLRNIPVLIIILFWYLGVVIRLNPLDEGSNLLGVFSLSNRGIVVPWLARTGSLGVLVLAAAVGLALAVAVWVWRTRRFDATGEPHRRLLWALGVLGVALVAGFFAAGRPLGLSIPEAERFGTVGGFRLSPEYGALVIALTLYTSSHIAEIVRGSILAVPRGQTEAADAVGLTAFQRLQHVVLPQAFRISVPPIANQYLNLTKNSSLGIAIGFYELTRVTRIEIGQGAPAPQATFVLMLFYLAFSLGIALVTNVINRRLEIKAR